MSQFAVVVVDVVVDVVFVPDLLLPWEYFYSSLDMI